MSIRSIFVTGANQGLGYHTVRNLAKTPNVLVFLGARDLSKAEEALAKFAADVHPSSTVVPTLIDLTDEKTIKTAAESTAKILKEKGAAGLDALVNNAAIAQGPDALVYATNVAGTVAVKNAFYPLLTTTGGAAIVNVSSTLGSLKWHTERPAPPVYGAYSASKSALNSFTLQWTIEEEQRKSGIRVVSICPGYNATNLNGHGGTKDPADGSMVIVKEALATEGESGRFFNEEGPIGW
ncbi:unnamed protein product [Mycena citricolor]|uniref:NAD(P)-binding protein n=1 Tax=Mycena citricolor TaxID=2018698 RepID=A0AAD2K0H2_9AGAR|nr:unnamed protein product [Mycena citricolor]